MLDKIMGILKLNLHRNIETEHWAILKMKFKNFAKYIDEKVDLSPLEL